MQSLQGRESGAKRRVLSVIVTMLGMALIVVCVHKNSSSSLSRSSRLEQKNGPDTASLGSVDLMDSPFYEETEGQKMVRGLPKMEGDKYGAIDPTKLELIEAEPHHLGLVKTDLCCCGNNGYRTCTYRVPFTTGYQSFGIRKGVYHYAHQISVCEYLRKDWGEGVNAAFNFLAWEKWILSYNTVEHYWTIHTAATDTFKSHIYLRMNDHFVKSQNFVGGEEKFSIYLIKDAAYVSYSSGSVTNPDLTSTRGVLIRGKVKTGAWLKIRNRAAHGGKGADVLEIVRTNDGCCTVSDVGTVMSTEEKEWKKMSIQVAPAITIGWTVLEGSAVKVSISSNSHSTALYVVNSHGNVFAKRTWPSGTVWFDITNGIKMKSMAVSNDGNMVVAIAQGASHREIYYRNNVAPFTHGGKDFKGTGWSKSLSGLLSQVTVGGLYIYGVNGHEDPWQRSRKWQTWCTCGGKLVQISAHGDKVVGVNNARDIFQYLGNKQYKHYGHGGKGLLASMGSDGEFWVIGTDHNAYKWNGAGWTRINLPGRIKHLDVASRRKIAAIREDNKIVVMNL